MSDGRMLVLRCAPTAQQIPLLQHTPGKHGLGFCTGREGPVIINQELISLCAIEGLLPPCFGECRKPLWGTVGWSVGRSAVVTACVSSAGDQPRPLRCH